jgi:hypothetical protein
MDQIKFPNSHRIGFHYYPDTCHFRQSDLETWLPRLVELGAAWLTVLAPAERAIPESFIRGLLSAGIQPLLHFCLPVGQPAPVESLRLLLGPYSRWGVRQVAFYQRPNARSSWPAAAWARNDLVERFLDDFTPLALAAQAQGLTVITPPLEPGGDYWDLSFLRTALRSLQRRGGGKMLESLALGAYAWINERPLGWGAGGPERWPGARPYSTPAGQQDQLGFRIFDWYLSVCQQELGFRLPIYLLRAGQRLPSGLSPEQGQPTRLSHARQNLSAARWMAGDPGSTHAADAVSLDVKACNFWLLAAEEGDQRASQSWFQPSGERLPAVEAFRTWVAYQRKSQAGALPMPPAETGGAKGNGAGNGLTVARVALAKAVIAKNPADNISFDNISPDQAAFAKAALAKAACDQASPVPVEPVMNAPIGIVWEAEPLTVSQTQTGGSAQIESAPAPDATLSPVKSNGKGQLAAKVAHPIGHYVLLPLYAWGAANWDLALVEPLLQESHPAIGFSLAEARLARRVTVVGAEGAVSDEALGMLRNSGCQVERLLEDGTLVAT